MPYPFPPGAVTRPWAYGAVYAIGHVQPDGSISQPFKIGRVGPGGDVKARLLNIQLGSPAKLAVRVIQPVQFSASAIEKLIHLALHNRRMSGEWFDCSLARVQQVMDAALKYEREPIQRQINASREAKKLIFRIVEIRAARAIAEWKQWDRDN